MRIKGGCSVRYLAPYGCLSVAVVAVFTRLFVVNGRPVPHSAAVRFDKWLSK